MRTPTAVLTVLACFVGGAALASPASAAGAEQSVAMTSWDAPYLMETTPLDFMGGEPWVLNGQTVIGSAALVGNLYLDRFPGPGRYPISNDGREETYQVSQVFTCTDSKTGIADVTEAEYDGDGKPLHLALDVHWTCGNGDPAGHTVVRVHSAVPFTRVEIQAPPQVKVSAGDELTQTWVVRNTGTSSATIDAATLTAPEALDQVDSSQCTAAVLAPSDTCVVTGRYTAPPASDPSWPIGGTLLVDVKGFGQSMAHSSFIPVPPMSIGEFSHVGASPYSVLLSWDAGQPGGSPRHYEVQEQVNGSWAPRAAAEAAELELVNETPGATRVFRARSVDEGGRVTGWNTPTSVVTPVAALVGVADGRLYGGNLDGPVPGAAPFGPPSGVTGVDLSPDRKHLAVTRCTAEYACVLELTQLDGTHAVAVYERPAGLRQPRFSPDGSRILVTEKNVGFTTEQPMIIDVATGAPTWVPQAGLGTGWDPQGERVLVALYPGPLQWVTPGTSLRVALPGSELTASATVSRDGTVVYASQTGLWRVKPSGERTALNNGGAFTSVRFDPTGTSVAVASTWSWSLLDVATGTSRPTGLPGGRDMTWLLPASAAPVVAVNGPTFSGPSVTLGIGATDPDDAVGGLRRECRVDAHEWSPCTASLALTGLTVGPHTVSARATDPAGNASAAASRTWTVDASAPVATLSAPAAVVTATRLALVWSAADAGGSGIASYDLRARTAPLGGSFGAAQYPSTWQRIATKGLTVSVSQGTQYCFSVRARDAAGNVSSWTGERCTSVTLDDRLLSASSQWVRRNVSSAAFGTDTYARATGASLSRSSVRARRVAIVVTTCATCGSVDVYHAGVRLGRLSLYSATTRVRQVLWLPLQPTSRLGMVTVRTTSAKTVVVDGIATIH